MAGDICRGLNLFSVLVTLGASDVRFITLGVFIVLYLYVICCASQQPD